MSLGEQWGLKNIQFPKPLTFGRGHVNTDKVRSLYKFGTNTKYVLSCNFFAFCINSVIPNKRLTTSSLANFDDPHVSAFVRFPNAFKRNLKLKNT
jgi:hypothetical protein